MPVPGPELDISQFGDGIVKEVILTGLQADSKQGQCEDPGTYSAALSWGACLPPPESHHSVLESIPAPVQSTLCPGEHTCPPCNHNSVLRSMLTPLKSSLHLLFFTMKSVLQFPN